MFVMSKIAERRNGLGWLSLVLLVLVVMAGCTSAAADSTEPVGGGSAPVSLPAGEDAPQPFAAAPPLGASLGTDVASQPNRLELPSIGVDTDVVKIGWRSVEQADGTVASQWEVADYAAGWHKNSALPGQAGNTVMSGHNNIRGAVFRKLYTMQEGDMAYVWAGGRRFAYQVDEVMILKEKGAPIEQRRDNAKWIQHFDDKRLTLVSCWPEDDNTHRVIVVAHEVDE